jgi:hypothetical protein
VPQPTTLPRAPIPTKEEIKMKETMKRRRRIKNEDK